MSKTRQLRVPVFPLSGKQLDGDVAIADHINLAGDAPSLGFNPITELYKAKHEAGAIVVACLKAGTKPNAAEEKILIENGVSAYSYDLLEPALYAAANEQVVEAYAYVPSLPQGFELYADASGAKPSGAKDLGLILADQECTWAGTFTQNTARAFCVEKNIELLVNKIKAVLVNSGDANACTGVPGEKADLDLRDLVAGNFTVEPDQVLTASTGKIGTLPAVDKFSEMITAFSQTASVSDFAEAILTTDTVIKISQDASKNILGIAKGSGMINPNMATMLAFLMTDVEVDGMSQEQMQELLNQAVAASFNAISVDGDTSTNDMVILVQNPKSKKVSLEEFQESLNYVCKDLAHKILNDGEGTTKIIDLTIKGTNDREAAKSIINSPLLKTAIFGNDPNWGRIIAGLGNSGIKNKLNSVELFLLGQKLFTDGQNLDFSRDEMTEKMKRNKNIEILVDLNNGSNEEVRVWGSDLSYKYVEINAEYTT